MLASLDFWSAFITLDSLVYREEFRLRIFGEVLPHLVGLCKVRREDWEKFRKDQRDPDTIEKNVKKDINEMTVRSKAAKTIEKVAGRFEICLFCVEKH